MEKLDQEFAEKYPKIFKEYCGFNCGDGWYDIINTLCTNIQNYIDFKHREGHPIEQVVSIEVKEKFGELRFDTKGGNEVTTAMIVMAESFARRTCEVCGDKGKRRSGDWIQTLCDEHASV